jgi:hypothetical protein
LTVYLDLVDYLLIAERVLGLPAEAIAKFNRIGLADSALAAPQAGFGWAMTIRHDAEAALRYARALEAGLSWRGL